jgi:lysophospholipase L1-like esterase
MEFRTVVDIPKPGFEIGACEEMLFVGSCFADSIGQRFREEGFPVTVNPYGTMYNPASVLHTIQRLIPFVVTPRMVFLTLGTNHVYRLKETGEIVDNCEKRPASLFQEEELTVEACADYLSQAIGLLRQMNPDVRIVLTVSPIRYRKYGYHGSQLSKATLLLAVEKICVNLCPSVAYFPAYEIVNDELRDYRFYASDMLHPSEQAVEYIWERLVETYFSPQAKTFIEEWRPLKQALGHKPFAPDAPETLRFQEQTRQRLEAFKEKYPGFVEDRRIE